MPTKVFVGKIAEGTTNGELKALFEKFGKVEECDIVSNFGFVHMASDGEAKDAIAALDGYSIRGVRLTVELSTVRTQGRKRRADDASRGGGRVERPSYGDRFGGSSRGGKGYSSYDAGSTARRALPDYAERAAAVASGADMVRDLIELYIRDPYEFDRYARAYYYGRIADARDREAAMQTLTSRDVMVRRDIVSRDVLSRHDDRLDRTSRYDPYPMRAGRTLSPLRSSLDRGRALPARSAIGRRSLDKSPLRYS